VLDATGADGLLIGRAAQGRPWIFREIEHYLRTGEHLPAPQLDEVERILLEHLAALHAFYGDVMGVRIARKHVGWYLATAGRQGVSRPVQRFGRHKRSAPTFARSSPNVDRA
jgi:tRNA-dihydrouridine synthase B